MDRERLERELKRLLTDLRKAKREQHVLLNMGLECSGRTVAYLTSRIATLEERVQRN